MKMAVYMLSKYWCLYYLCLAKDGLPEREVTQTVAYLLVQQLQHYRRVSHHLTDVQYSLCFLSLPAPEGNIWLELLSASLCSPASSSPSLSAVGCWAGRVHVTGISFYALLSQISTLSVQLIKLLAYRDFPFWTGTLWSWLYSLDTFNFWIEWLSADTGHFLFFFLNHNFCNNLS